MGTRSLICVNVFALGFALPPMLALTGVHQDFADGNDSSESGLILRRLRRVPRCLSPRSGRVLRGPGEPSRGGQTQIGPDILIDTVLGADHAVPNANGA